MREIVFGQRVDHAGDSETLADRHSGCGCGSACKRTDAGVKTTVGQFRDTAKARYRLPIDAEVSHNVARHLRDPHGQGDLDGRVDLNFVAQGRPFRDISFCDRHRLGRVGRASDAAGQHQAFALGLHFHTVAGQQPVDCDFRLMRGVG